MAPSVSITDEHTIDLDLADVIETSEEKDSTDEECGVLQLIQTRLRKATTDFVLPLALSTRIRASYGTVLWSLAERTLNKILP